MKVMELREQLKDMPGEMYVYIAGDDAHGIASAKHIFRGNLIGVDQFCELRTAFQEHTPQFEDIKIERYTGCKDRDELIEAFNNQKEELEALKNPPAEPAVMVSDDIYGHISVNDIFPKKVIDKKQ